MDTPPNKRAEADRPASSRCLGPYARREQRRLRLEARAARATARRIARLPRIDAEEKRERERARRLARQVLGEAARRGAIADFIINALREAGVSVSIVAIPRASPSVRVGALIAPTVAKKLECERGFQRAVEDSLAAIVLLATDPRGRA